MPDPMNYKTTDYCARCGESPESGTHMVPGHGHECVPRGGLQQSVERVLGVQRVKVETRPGVPQFGQFLGLLLDEHGDTLAVVRLDHFGLMLKSVHPSCVVPVTPEEEEAYKP